MLCKECVIIVIDTLGQCLIGVNSKSRQTVIKLTSISDFSTELCRCGSTQVDNGVSPRMHPLDQGRELINWDRDLCRTRAWEDI